MNDVVDQRVAERSAAARKLAELRRVVAGCGAALVAYSGGVDSTVLAYVAHEQLGERALACTAVSPAIPPEELEAAVGLAQRLGIRHRVVRTDEVRTEAYALNAPNRCYVCKGIVFGRLLEVAAEEGLPWLLHGANLDDGNDYRPGGRAAAEMGARAPLVEAGLTKSDVRAVARILGLPNADKPAAPCLSSRIPYGDRVTIDKLRQIGAAERAVRALGFGDVRVRHHGVVARLEVPAAELEQAVETSTRLAIVRELRALGFAYVALDLRGFRSGSLNEVLAGQTGAGPDRGRAGPAARDGGA